MSTGLDEDARTQLAIRVLSRRHPAMRRFIRRAGPVDWRRRQSTDFEALLRSIVFQQLAGAAAAAIHARVVAVLGEVTPEAVLAAEEASLRRAGLSAAKLLSIRQLAEAVVTGRLPLDHLATLDDEQVIAAVSAVRGIGRWTAQMFMLFQLRRPDVWPAGDLAVRRGFSLIHGLECDPTPRQVERLGEVYRGHRSVAALYCWRAVHLSRTGGLTQ